MAVSYLIGPAVVDTKIPTNSTILNEKTRILRMYSRKERYYYRSPRRATFDTRLSSNNNHLQTVLRVQIMSLMRIGNKFYPLLLMLLNNIISVIVFYYFRICGSIPHRSWNPIIFSKPFYLYRSCRCVFSLNSDRFHLTSSQVIKCLFFSFLIHMTLLLLLLVFFLFKKKKILFPKFDLINLRTYVRSLFVL